MKNLCFHFLFIVHVMLGVIGCGSNSGTSVPGPNAPSPASMNDLPPEELEARKKAMQEEMKQ